MTFISDSYKRMNIWTDVHDKKCNGAAKLNKLPKIGNTHWWSKQAALQGILDSFENLQADNFCQLLKV